MAFVDELYNKFSGQGQSNQAKVIEKKATLKRNNEYGLIGAEVLDNIEQN